MYQKGVQDVVNINKIKSEPHGNLIDQSFSQFDETMIYKQDSNDKIENDETPEVEYCNENGSEDAETNQAATPIFMPQKLPDDEIAEGVNSLNSQQKQVFYMVHTWNEDYIKYNNIDMMDNIELVLIFLSRSGDTGKSHLVKVIYNAISKTSLFHCKGSEKPRVFYLNLQDNQHL